MISNFCFLCSFCGQFHICIADWPGQLPAMVIDVLRKCALQSEIQILIRPKV